MTSFWASRLRSGLFNGARRPGCVCMFVLECLLRIFYEYPMLTVGTLLVAGYIAASLHKIGPTEVGLVTKRFSFKKLAKDNPVAFSGEAGYQADLLMPGLRWKAFMVYSVEKYPWVQVPAGEIGVVIAQVGNPLPIGAKSAVYKKEFANFSDLRGFVQLGGQKGVQRPVLPPGSLVPVHPLGFLILTRSRVEGTAPRSTWSASLPRTRVTRCRPATLLADWVATSTSKNLKLLAALPQTRRLSKRCSAARTTCTTTIRTSRAFWIMAVTLVSSTIRCSMAPTH